MSFCIINWLTVGRLLEVHVGIAEGPAGDHVSAHSDRQDGPGRAEFLVEHGLGYVLVQVSHVKGSHRVAWRAWVHGGRRVPLSNNTILLKAARYYHGGMM